MQEHFQHSRNNPLGSAVFQKPGCCEILPDCVLASLFALDNLPIQKTLGSPSSKDLGILEFKHRHKGVGFRVLGLRVPSRVL